MADSESVVAAIAYVMRFDAPESHIRDTQFAPDYAFSCAPHAGTLRNLISPCCVSRFRDPTTVSVLINRFSVE